MAKSFLMPMLISIVIFNMARPISSQKIDPYSQVMPEDVNISPTYHFDISVEAPNEAPSEADSPISKYDTALVNRYSRKQLKFLDDCLQKTTTKCGDEIFNNMLDETTEMTNQCCRELLKLGIDCHLGLVKLTFSSYEYKNIASKAIPKSKQTWNTCVRQVGSQIGVPISSEQ